jgi:riboflavin synthase
MFTGIIESIGEIKRTAPGAGGSRLTIHCSLPAHEIILGESIAVDGACLTVTGITAHGFMADVSPETLQRTTLAARKTGDKVNLERALRLSDRLGGHLVTGHIDGTGIIRSIDRRGDFFCIRIEAPAQILAYVVEKGCIAVDGISLTVNTCAHKEFSVMVIPHTLQQTTLQYRKIGDVVNLENDIIAKYVEKFLVQKRVSGITREMIEQFDSA